MAKDKSRFIESYIDQMTEIFQKMHPDWDTKRLHNEVAKIVYEQVKDVPILIENNYLHEERDTTLITIFDWFAKHRPILSGNATFYKRQSESFNPTAEMLQSILKERKALKKELFSIPDEDSYEYQDKDRQQNNKKKLANSWYGGSGAPHAAFYSEFSIPATTGAAQSVISSTLWLFEPLLGDNYKFSDINECFHWMRFVLKQNEDVELDDFIEIPTRDELFFRLRSKFYNYDAMYGPVLNDWVNSLTNRELAIIFYQNNLITFMERHSLVRDLIIQIIHDVLPIHEIDESDINFEDSIPSEYHGMFKTAKDYNKFRAVEGFLDPNKVPERIKDTIDTLYKLVRKYCFVPYLAFDRIWKLKNLKRKVVTVIDTDSNILSLDTIINYIIGFTNTEDFGKSGDQLDIIMINTVTYIITNAVSELLWLYATMSNIDDDYKKYLGMKNEFYMNRLFVGLAKKRYFSSIRLREGNLLKKPKQDMKGFEIKKAVVSKDTSELFVKMIKRHFLDSDKPQIKACMKELVDFKDSVIASIRAGELTYLPIVSCKDASAYSDPSSQQSYRGSVMWNYFYPDNPIEYPSKASLLKLTIITEDDAAPLRHTHPDIYNTIIDKVFRDTKRVFIKSGKNGNINCSGMVVLAIPTNTRIPEWCMPYIDYTTLVNNIIAPFNPILEIFGIPPISEGKSTGGHVITERFSNIVRF